MIGNGGAWDQIKTLLLESDVAYFRRRAAEENEKAVGCYDPRVRQVHLDMAERYRHMAMSIAAFEHHLNHRFDTAA
jgi:hypothetical protein